MKLQNIENYPQTFIEKRIGVMYTNIKKIFAEIKKLCYKNGICIMKFLVVLLLLIIFQDALFSFVDKAIIPLFSSVKSDSLGVLLCVILLVLFIYLSSGFLIYRKNYIKLPNHSLCLVAVGLVFYGLFRCNEDYDFTSYGPIAYVDAFFVSAIVMEILSYFYKRNKFNTEIYGFKTDAPSKSDEFGRADYAELLIDKICATYNSGSLKGGAMTILLNERYGAGKSTFFNFLEAKAKGKIRTCVFKPWITTAGEGMNEELLRLLREKYDINDQLGKQLEDYAKLLSGNGPVNVLKVVAHALNVQKSLGQLYDSIKDILQIINVPLIVMVDDVDRLQSDELLALLKLLRNTADFPNIIYIVAADKDAMSQMFEVKGIRNADDYLKKFFNFELLFPIDDSFLSSLMKEQITEVYSAYGIKSSTTIEGCLSFQHLQSVFHSPRDVYRFINLLTYTLDLFKHYGVLEEVNMSDLLKLLLIQFVSPMVYKILRDEMYLLLEERKSDGRIYLKEGYNIISRQTKQMLDSVSKTTIGVQDNTTGDTRKGDSKEDKTHKLFEIPEEERPNKEDIISDLLQGLFGDSVNYQTKDRICFVGEYFKFFAGKYSKEELSAKYMKETMELSNESSFEERISQTIKQGKADFLVHKLRQYVEDETISKDIPMVLNRCITIQDAVYCNWARGNDSLRYPKDFNRVRKFDSVYSELLLVDKMHIVKDKEEIEIIKTIYAKNTKYAWLSSSLYLPIHKKFDMNYIYGNEILEELKERLICRFIGELAEKPFEREKIMALPLLRRLNSQSFDEKFKEMVNSSSDSKAWLYMLFEPYDDSLEWNNDMCDNLVGEGPLDRYAENFLGLSLPQKIKDDLGSIICKYDNLTAIDFANHPFLMEAKKWWDEKHNNI